MLCLDTHTSYTKGQHHHEHKTKILWSNMYKYSPWQSQYNTYFLSLYVITLLTSNLRVKVHLDMHSHHGLKTRRYFLNHHV